MTDDARAGDSSTDGFSLSSLMQLSMPAGDIDRSVAFYRDTLGTRFLFQAGTLASSTWTACG